MRPSDSRVSERSYLVVIAGAALAGIGLGILSTSPSTVERWFTEGFGSVGSQIVSSLTGTVPFSLAEWVEGAVIAWLLLAPIPALAAVRRGERRGVEVVRAGVLQLLALTGLALVVFYGLWGLNYARPSATDRLGWAVVDLTDPSAPDELEDIANALVDQVNLLYRALHDSDDIGTISEPDGSLDLEQELDRAWERVAADLDLHHAVAKPRGPAKPLLSSPLWSYLGIAGFYFPYTGEANYNRDQPTWQRVHTIAHEKAHQRGFASEDEANFFGFLACIQSEDRFVRYGGWLFAQRKILAALHRADPQRSAAITERRLPGVQRDVDEMRAFWAGYAGPMSTVGSTVNDAYLRANRVEGGIASYSHSVRLIVAWIREDPSALNRPNNL